MPVSLWFYSKDEANNFNANTVASIVFKCFKYKAKLLGKAEAAGTNGILKKATAAL